MSNEKELFSIGEIARALGLTRRIILHYEERGLIQPDSRNGETGNRYYSIDTFIQLRSIRSMQNLGLTLDEIRDYYNDSADLTPLIQRLEKKRDELNLNIEKLYERSKTRSGLITVSTMPRQWVYRRGFRSDSIEERKELLRSTALEAMRDYGTDISRRLYFLEYSVDDPAEITLNVAVPEGSEGEFILSAPPMRAVSAYHHGAYEELPNVARRLADYAAEHGLTPTGRVRHTYLEGPPQHKDPEKFITQVALEIGEEGAGD